ncbi:MAG: hypothetical protein M4579_003752 [Chaenotheca gracillima]|nr:MAG: hypothetical protein M4579_003752 [Chaenotheca gracillima]
MESRPKAYIVLPASVTGDLWHLAAAQILSKKEPVAHPCDFVTVVARFDWKVGEMQDQAGDTKAVKDAKAIWRKNMEAELRNGPVSFDYLRGIGLDCMAVLISGPSPRSCTTRNLEKIMYMQPQSWYDKVYATQAHNMHSTQPFNVAIETFDRSTSPSIPPPAQNAQDNWWNKEYTPEPRVLPLMTATTIAMRILLPADTRQDLWKGLSVAMSAEPFDTGKNIEKKASDKLTQLLGIVESEKKKHDGDRRVLLFNYRVNTVNQGTNATNAILEQVRKLTDLDGKPLIVIRVVAGLAKDQIQKNDFDLFNALEDAPYPGIDPHVTARFWHKVAAQKEIVGIVSGRSGSVDIAAFTGVKALFYDEPWLRVAAGDVGAMRSLVKYLKTPEGVIRQDENKKDMLDQSQLQNGLSNQIPQCLRSLQLYPIMAVALPENTASPDAEWALINPDALELWLKQCLTDSFKGEIYPKYAGWDTKPFRALTNESFKPLIINIAPLVDYRKSELERYAGSQPTVASIDPSLQIDLRIYATPLDLIHYV